MSDAPSLPEGRLLSGAPAYRPATPWRPGPAVLVTAIIVVAGLATSVAALLLAGLWTGAPVGSGDGSSPAPRLWSLAVLQAVVVALTLLACRRFGGRVGDVLALHRAPTGWRAYAGALLAMAALQGLLAVVQHFLLRHDMLTDLRPFVGLVTGPNWLLAAAVLVIGAPLSEELLFRGFLFGALAKNLDRYLSVLIAGLFRIFPGALARRSLGFWSAAVLSSAAWTTLHAGYSPMGLAEVFAMGLLLSWLLWRTGSLRVPILCHAVYNGLIVLALLLVGLPAVP